MSLLCLKEFKIEKYMLCSQSLCDNGIVWTFSSCVLLCLLNWIQCVFAELAQSSRNKSDT